MQDAYAVLHERQMVILDKTYIPHAPPRHEEALVALHVRFQTQHARGSEPLFRGNQRVKQPGGVEKVGLHERVLRAQKVEEDEMLDGG